MSHKSTAAASKAHFDVTVTSVAFSPAELAGGKNSTGTVTLSGPAPKGGAKITLTKDDEGVDMPTSVIVAANATTATFTAKTSAVTETQIATITATYGQSSAKGTLTIDAQGYTLTNFYLPPNVVSSSYGNATVSVSPAPKIPLNVTMTSDDPDLVVAKGIQVPIGKNSAGFQFKVIDVPFSKTITVTASLGGVSISKKIAVIANSVASLTVTPKDPIGGSNIPVKGTVTMAYAAGTADTTTVVAYTSDGSHIDPFVVKPGSKTAEFSFYPKWVTAETDVTVTAKKIATTPVSQTIKIKPNLLLGIGATPPTIVGNSQHAVLIGFTIKAPVLNPVAILLQSGDTTLIQVPQVVIIEAGKSNGSFTVKPGPPISPKEDVRLTASCINSVTCTVQVLRPPG